MAGSVPVHPRPIKEKEPACIAATSAACPWQPANSRLPVRRRRRRASGERRRASGERRAAWVCGATCRSGPWRRYADAATFADRGTLAGPARAVGILAAMFPAGPHFYYKVDKF